MRKKAKKRFTYTWVFEAFVGDSTFCEKRMFGGLAAYVQDRMVMVLMESPGERSYRGKEFSIDIWDGIMFPTERVYHASLMKEFPSLVPHPVLGKWLYLPASDDDFETNGNELAGKIAENDERLGIY